MNKIMQKKSNLRILVESITDGMSIDKMVPLGANGIRCSDRYIESIHGDCPIKIRDANGMLITCDKFMIGDEDSDTVFLAIDRGQYNQMQGMYDYVEFAYRFKEDVIDFFKRNGETLPSEWQTFHSYHFLSELRVKPTDTLKAWLGDKKVYDNTNG